MARRTRLHCWLAPAAKIFGGGCGQSAGYARFPTFLRLKLNPSRILTKTLSGNSTVENVNFYLIHLS